MYSIITWEPPAQCIQQSPQRISTVSPAETPTSYGVLDNDDFFDYWAVYHWLSNTNRINAHQYVLDYADRDDAKAVTLEY
jgi:cobalamin biosynthesis Mg chelatase CobN